MTRFAVRQHDALRTATGKRHHLNLLLHDLDQENARTYGDRAPGLLSGTKLRHHASQVESTSHTQKQETCSKSFRVAHQLPSLTEQALGLSATVKFQDSLSSSSASDASVPPVLTCGTQAASLGCSMPSGSPSWLTPQQLHDRPLGMKVARMMNSHRTPIGDFANFDMPVAP